jgi:AcrR family transcriptional regulator
MTDHHEQWKRARKPEQKRRRRAEILMAAARVFEREGFDGVTLNGVAREAGLAKSNLYRYFESLEEILLHLLLFDFDDMLDDLDRLPESEPECTRDLADLLAVEMERRPRLAILLTQLAVVLERNLSEGVGVRFKTAIAERSGRLGRWLSARVSDLQPGQLQSALMTMHALLAGFWPMGHPNDVMESVLKREEVQHLRVHFRPAFRDAFSVYLSGLLMVDENGRPKHKTTRI